MTVPGCKLYAKHGIGCEWSGRKAKVWCGPCQLAHGIRATGVDKRPQRVHTRS